MNSALFYIIPNKWRTLKDLFSFLLYLERFINKQQTVYFENYRSHICTLFHRAQRHALLR